MELSKSTSGEREWEAGRGIVVVAVVAGGAAALCLSVLGAPPSGAPASRGSGPSLLQPAPSASEALAWKPLRRSAWAAPGTSTSTVAMAGLSQVRQRTEPSFMSAAESGVESCCRAGMGCACCLAGVWLRCCRPAHDRQCRMRRYKVQDAGAGPIDLSQSGMTSAVTGRSCLPCPLSRQPGCRVLQLTARSWTRQGMRVAQAACHQVPR